MYHTSIIAWVACILLLPTMAQFPSNCSQLPPHNPTTILDLRPNDVTVIMAMGDSITTGFGVDNTFNETYGVSFSIGGNPGSVTLANLFQNFTTLTGYSLGSASAQVCYGSNCPSARYYNQESNNAAKSGATVVDMTSSQITYLIRQLNQNPLIDVQNSWKVLTIMIGMNDLCASCAFNLTYLSADDYQNNLMATLERVRISLPRTFVNLVGLYNVTQAFEISKKAKHCFNLTRDLFIECDCIFHHGSGAIRATIDASIAQFNQRAMSVAAYYQRKSYDNFAVVFQPFATNTYLSRLPSEFLSKMDCFHPSLLGQQAMAVALWNNMLTPAASKRTSINMSDTPICPSSTTLLYTY